MKTQLRNKLPSSYLDFWNNKSQNHANYYARIWWYITIATWFSGLVTILWTFERRLKSSQTLWKFLNCANRNHKIMLWWHHIKNTPSRGKSMWPEGCPGPEKFLPPWTRKCFHKLCCKRIFYTTISTTLWRHYNTVVYNRNLVITRSRFGFPLLTSPVHKTLAITLITFITHISYGPQNQQ